MNHLSRILAVTKLLSMEQKCTSFGVLLFFFFVLRRKIAVSQNDRLCISIIRASKTQCPSPDVYIDRVHVMNIRLVHGDMLF